MGLLSIRSPASFRLSMEDAGMAMDPYASTIPSPFVVFKKKTHDAHPSLDHLVLLVFEAVMEVVCVSLPGYIIARLGHFDADKQKFLANLNVMLFTPCLIFTKLASQLNADKLLDLAVIPIIFVILTFVSYMSSRIVAKCFRLNQRATNFVTAMGVFGNSNSLPISLVMSLSQTIQGLHWDKIKGDNDDEVAARGILYLLIFQQLGQLVRWSWGYHVLLAPKDKYEEYAQETAEEGRFDNEDVRDEEETHGLIQGVDPLPIDQVEGEGRLGAPHHHRSPTQSSDSDAYEPAGRTPVAGTTRASPNDSEDDEDYNYNSFADAPRKRSNSRKITPHLYHGHHGLDPNPVADDGTLDDILSFPRIHSNHEQEAPPGIQGLVFRAKALLRRLRRKIAHDTTNFARRSYNSLPEGVQKGLATASAVVLKVYQFMWEFMNPPLWAMLIAVLVASIPDLQRLFFQEGSFIKNSVTSAVSSSAGVAVPLILVVLGANLARNTQNLGDDTDPEEKQIGKRLLIASLISRMLLPTLIMTPILALLAKYVPVSILDDPIFLIVCFLLTGAPSALQLAQICQINSVYEGVMGRILFQSYVIWILPSTLILVMAALEVVEWAK
ncbi:auxin efflux carrier [Thozetella sp. PMI_491]|nr:auxin efflux carrier [Thozetella sp. PMI_491]